MGVHLMIIRESIQFIHKVLTKKSPGVIYDLFMQSNLDNIREIRKYRVKNDHKSSNVTNSLFYRAVYFFNCLENEVRNYQSTCKTILRTYSLITKFRNAHSVNLYTPVF